MTEAEWLASEDPAAMLEHYIAGGIHPRSGALDQTTARKLRLFACACCRQVWDRLDDGRSRRAVEAAERYADGEATKEELRSNYEAAYDAADGSFESELAWRCVARMDALTANVGLPRWFSVSTAQAGLQARLLRDIVGKTIPGNGKVIYLRRSWLTPTVHTIAQTAYQERPGRECWSCQGYGNHLGHGPDRGNPECDTCHGTGRIDDGALDPARLAVLSDALEEAGCEDEAILRHLRREEWRPASVADGVSVTAWYPLRGPHVRGCWVLDLILGRE